MLSPEQLRLRQGKLTASRVACLIQGDAEEILRLWKEMIGEAQPEDLSHVWAVRLGECTEQLSLDWFEEKNKLLVTRRGEVVTHPDYPWAACTMDGFISDGLDGYCIEAKHVGGREPIEVIVDRYQPQCQWQMFVTGAQQCALSIILGANEPVVEYIDRANDYIAEMISRGQQFMDFVERRIPPVALPPVPTPVDATKIYDMTSSDSWVRCAQQWIQTHGAAETAKDAEKALKALVPPDASKAFGVGVRITRDRAGRLSLREDKGKP